jgi:non-ribosomal peptide synthase protein (TIGR01720 family)
MRLARDAAHIPAVDVVVPARWPVLGRTGPPLDSGHAALPSDVGVILARRILQGLGYSPRWIAVDPTGWSAFDLGRLAAAQLRCGRRVLLADAPGRHAAGLAGEYRHGDGLRDLDGGLVTGLPGLIASGELAAAGGLVIARGPDMAADLRRVLPTGDVMVADGGPAAQHSWLLDPPLGTHGPRPWTDLAGPADQVAHPDTGAPQTEEERTLAEIWGELLHLDSVHVTDDFFSLGGDSMLAIEVAFRAAEAGMSINPRQIMDRLSVRQLAATLATAPDAAAAPAAAAAANASPADSPVTDAPLSPAQQWFFDAVAPGTARPERFNHPYYLQLERHVTPGEVRRIAVELAVAHDSLRLRLRRDATGGWRQWCAPADTAMPVQTLDFTDLPPGQREEAIEAAATAAQSSLSFDGPLIRLLHLRSGPAEGDRLLFVAHHLVTDGISRRILLENLGELLLGLPPDSSPSRSAMSYLQWATKVHEYAQSARLRAELPFWLEQRLVTQAAIPMDLPGPFTFGTLAEDSFALTEPETTALLGEARRMGLKVNELMVWGLAAFVADWTGQRECGLTLAGYAREPIFDNMNASGTTGWFQVYYPLRFVLPPSYQDPQAAAGIARQIARVPGTGLGWGALRYLCEDLAVREQMAQVQMPKVSFNYTGHFSPAQAARPTDEFTICTMPYGLEQEADAVAPFDLHFSSSITGPRLHVLVQYSLNCHRPETARWILSTLRERLLSVISVGEVTTRQGTGASDAET